MEEGAGSPEALGAQLEKVHQALRARSRQVLLSIGVNDVILRQAELPMVPAADMRAMLKLNSRNYLQQDLTDHLFDCHILPSSIGSAAGASKPNPKCRVLVGGAKATLIDRLEKASRLANLTVEAIVPGALGPANAFELSHPNLFQGEATALVDIGFQNSSISIIRGGELVLTRVVAIGGDRLTHGIAESLGTSYDEAESIKVGLAHEVESTMVTLLSPLGRELRASIDFFEHQQDTTVSQVFVSGGAANSENILQILQTEVMLPCVGWNSTSVLSPSLRPEQMAELEGVASQLTVAVGAGLSAF